MSLTLWLTEGLSSQRDIISSIKSFWEKSFCNKSFVNKTSKSLTLIASHRNQRNEILSLADIALIEPKEDKQRFQFIVDTVEEYGVNAIHAGRNPQWYEAHRVAIEALGVTLTTGATDATFFELADDKVEFATFMQQHALPVVSSVQINSADQLSENVAQNRLLPHPVRLCVKPVTGIYGMGFWRFDDSANPMAAFTHPDNRKVHPDLYLHALKQQGEFAPLVLMPYLPGPEYSVDMLVNKGKVLAAVARRKEGSLQYLEQSGEAYHLALRCAEVMQGDGLINVQTRHNDDGVPVLLEINMRPSGGIGYTRHSGVNLPGLFALFTLGVLSAAEVTEIAQNSFNPAVVRPLTDAVPYSLTLENSPSGEVNA